MERLTNSGTKEAKPDVTIREALNKLAEYEDFEEIFRSKMTDIACNFLRDKEEFARWLDRNKWIAKKCDEYARAEKQREECLILSQKQQCEECICNSCSYKEDCCPDCEGVILGCEEYLEVDGDREKMEAKGLEPLASR